MIIRLIFFVSCRKKNYLLFVIRCILCHLEFTSITIMEAQSAAIAAKPIPARAKMSSVVLSCFSFQLN